MTGVALKRRYPVRGWHAWHSVLAAVMPLKIGVGVHPWYKNKILGLPGLSFWEGRGRSGGATAEHRIASKLLDQKTHLLVL